MQDLNKRLDCIEERLFDIEQKLGMTKPEVAKTVESKFKQTIQAGKPVQSAPDDEWIEEAPDTRKKSESVSATRALAWCAGFTFLLAMVYFLKLVYDTGWLTPMRQLGLAYTAAAVLIFLGIYLEKEDRQYASYLPAFGLVTLYLTTFTAHLYYELLARQPAMVLIGLATLLGIWLGRRFQHSVYLLFSAVGVYISPFLIHSETPALLDLVIYYSAWSLLFSFSALQEERRLTYLLPMYLAMLGFDFLWREANSSDWLLAANFQLVQFVIFSVTTVLFSVIHRNPVREDSALAHGLALFIFYSLEYALLEQHVPEWVNTIAVLSAVVVYLLYVIARYFYKGEQALTQGATLVSYYCSWVALHAVFFGELPERWLPWAALVTPMAFFLLSSRLQNNRKAMLPITLACGGLFLMGYGLLVFGLLGHKTTVDAPMPTMALSAYVLMLYGMYYHFSSTQGGKIRTDAALVLYAGHLAFLVCLTEWVAQDIYLSALWACYAVALLVLAIQISDKVLGQSALLIFCAAGLKVLLYDLSDSNSMVRVITLLVLSVCLYLGGWLYQSLVQKSR